MKKKGSVLPRDFKAELPLAVKAEGIYIFDESGKRYIDGCSGALISNVGHCVPEIVKEISEQLLKLDFAHPSRWRNAATEAAAEELASLAPGDLSSVWFVAGGSEAIESAVKLARQYFVERDGQGSSKHLVVSRWNSYHGATLGAMSVSGNMARRRVYAPMFKDHPKIQPHYCYRCPFHLVHPACGLRCAEELEEMILALGAHYVAAFVAEPIVGSTVGALVAPEGYWSRVREICERHDVLLIADEIMTGLGRTGKAFCVDHWDVVPDIIVSAKGMAAGYVPTGGVLARAVIAETLKKGSGKFQHGFTYNANPVSGAATAAVIRYLKKKRLIENAAAQGRRMAALLAPLTEIPIVGEVRGKGLMWGLELVRDQASRAPFPRSRQASGVLTRECLKRGLVVYPGGGMINGVDGDNVLIAPPLIVDESQVEEICSLLKEALEAAARSLLA